MQEKDILAIINFFYPEEGDLKRTLLKHSQQVRDKALELAARTPLTLDVQLLSAGAMLHDIGIVKCHAPRIFCMGDQHYLRHGVEGAAMLREYGKSRGIDLEAFALICERHTGSGLTAADIAAQGLPLPQRDFLPLSPEEKLVCLADKFFSKSGDMEEKKFSAVQRSMAEFGTESSERFNQMWEFFSFRSL